jgi:hypothetical protein
MAAALWTLHNLKDRPGARVMTTLERTLAKALT